MGARRGRDYLEGLRDGREIWLDGERVEDVATDPRLARTAQSIAALYDLQHREDLRERMVFESPSSHAPVGLSFLQPRAVGDLVRRREAFKQWADFSGGMLGRAPDFLSTVVTAFAAASDFFAAGGSVYGENIRQYYEHCRENDLCLTHALSRPVDEQAAAIHVVDANDRGVIVSGSRALATLAPFADEIMIFPGPAPRRLEQEGSNEHAIAFCAPVASNGLRFLCRAGMGGASVADHPLGARFDEQDAVVIFDRVLVPWSRVFVYRNREIANHLWAETKAFHQAAHQFLVKNLAKAEFVLGVTSLVAEASGADRHLHVQERLGEIVDVAETLRCFIRAAEVDAVPGPAGTLLPNPEVVETARNYFPTVYPRLIETLQIIGASGHIAHVSEAMASGPMGDIVEAHYRSATLGGRDRVRLLKLAWDMAASAFAGRQVIYERYFDGDPFRKRASRYTSYRHLDERRQHVREFLRAES